MKFYRSLKPIKAMTFDLDDTLYDNRPVIRQLEKQMQVWMHKQHPISVTQSPQWWFELKQSLAKHDPWLRHDVTLWRHRVIETGLIQLGYESQEARLAADDAITLALQWRSDFEVPQETHRVMAQLAQRYPLVAITNGNVDAERIGLADYFLQVLKAGDDGCAKPHRDMFDKACQHLRLPAHYILHVGDHLLTDVQGALNNGFQACWYNDQPVNLRTAHRARQLPHVEIHQLADLLAF